MKRSSLASWRRTSLAYWKCEARRHLRVCHNPDTCQDAAIARSILARRMGH